MSGRREYIDGDMNGGDLKQSSFSGAGENTSSSFVAPIFGDEIGFSSIFRGDAAAVFSYMYE